MDPVDIVDPVDSEVPVPFPLDFISWLTVCPSSVVYSCSWETESSDFVTLYCGGVAESSSGVIYSCSSEAYSFSSGTKAGASGAYTFAFVILFCSSRIEANDLGM